MARYEVGDAVLFKPLEGGLPSLIVNVRTIEINCGEYQEDIYAVVSYDGRILAAGDDDLTLLGATPPFVPT